MKGKGEEFNEKEQYDVQGVAMVAEAPSAPELPVAEAVPVSAAVSHVESEKPMSVSAPMTSNVAGARGYGSVGTNQGAPSVVTSTRQVEENVMLLPPNSADNRSGGCCGSAFTLKNIVRDYLYLLGVMINSIVSSVTLFVTTILGVALLPLCCFGLVFLNITFRLIGFFGRNDVRLYNYIALESERIKLSMKEQIRAEDLRSQRGFMLSPDVGEFSCKSFGGLIYFIVILPSLAFTAFLLSAVLTAVSAKVALVGAGVSEGFCVYEEYVMDSMLSGNFECSYFVQSGFDTFLVGVLMIVLAIWMTRAFTRFFMWLTRIVFAEYYHTYVYAPVGAYRMV